MNLLMLLVAAAVAQDAPPALRPEDAPANYALCLDTARTYPQQGFELANRWADLGGGEPAEHCLGVAQIGLGQYVDAGTRLERLALQTTHSAELRASLLAQAGQAWLLADNPARALETQTAALSLLNEGSPRTVPILIDRAMTQAESGRYAAAISDLDAALKVAPDNPDALAFRANAHRELDQLDRALADADRALAIDQAHAPALLERGIIHRLRKNNEAARADWKRVISLAPESETGKAAKAHLAQLDAGSKKSSRDRRRGQ